MNVGTIDGGYGSYGGVFPNGTGGIGVLLSGAARLDNQGTIAGGYGQSIDAFYGLVAMAESVSSLVQGRMAPTVARSLAALVAIAPTEQTILTAGEAARACSQKELPPFPMQG